MRRVLDWLRYANGYVAGAAAAMTAVTTAGLGLAVPWAVVGLVFFATLAVYLADRLVGDVPGDVQRQAFIHEHRRALWSTMGVALACAGACAGQLRIEAWAVLLPAAGVAAAYCLPVVPWRVGVQGPRGSQAENEWARGRGSRWAARWRAKWGARWGARWGWVRLTRVPMMKLLAVAGVWSAATVVLPAVEVTGGGSWRAWVWPAFERGVFIAALLIPFDIRDVAADRKARLPSLPVVWGVDPARRAAGCVLVLLAGVTVWLSWVGRVVETWPMAVGVAAAGVYLVSAWVVWRAGPARSESYLAWGVDGMVWLWAAVVGAAIYWFH